MISRDQIIAIRRRLAASESVVNAAVFLRKQLDWIVRYHLGEEADFRGNGEAELISALAPLCGSFLDVGANRGDWAQAFLGQMAPGGRGLLFDAGPAAAKHLRARFASDARVEVVHTAVGDRAGQIEFFEEPALGETSSLVAGFSLQSSARVVVPMTTVEAALSERGWTGADFLKVDVEGYDLHVLRGTGALLAGRRFGVIQFEYNQPWARAGSTLAAALALLGEAGYRVFLLRAGGLSEVDYARFGEYFGYSNYVAFASEWFERVRGKLTFESVT